MKVSEAKLGDKIRIGLDKYNSFTRSPDQVVRSIEATVIEHYFSRTTLGWKKGEVDYELCFPINPTERFLHSDTGTYIASDHTCELVSSSSSTNQRQLNALQIETNQPMTATIQDAKVGDRVIIQLDENGDLIEDWKEGQPTIEATLLKPSDGNGSYPVLGWKKGEPTPINVWSTIYGKLPAGFSLACYVPNDLPIHLPAEETPVSPSKFDLKAAEAIFKQAETYAKQATSSPKLLEQFYRKALLFNPKHGGAARKLGVLLYKQGNREESKEWSALAVKLEPDVADNHWNRAINLRPYPAFLKHLEKACRLKPRYLDDPWSSAVAPALIDKLKAEREKKNSTSFLFPMIVLSSALASLAKQKTQHSSATLTLKDEATQ